jgi:heme-degrading monooxygenase HmoA
VYSRVTLFEFDPVRFDVDDALERFKALVLPELHSQPGFEGAFVLANDEAKGMVLTLWASNEDAEVGLASGFWAAQVARFVALFAAPAGREGYDVVYAETPALEFS